MVRDRPRLYASFLGTWVLEPGTCVYQQGAPPKSGTYRIEDRAGRLYFTIDWIDADGNAQKAEFSGTPNGDREAFAGGDLADALSVHAVSSRELTSRAYYRGVERMVAQRQLDDSGKAMRVTQVVRLPDGTSLANIAIYRRQVLN